MVFFYYHNLKYLKLILFLKKNCICGCRGYVGIHSSGFRDFLLKPELLRAIVDSGFEHPSEGNVINTVSFYVSLVLNLCINCDVCDLDLGVFTLHGMFTCVELKHSNFLEHFRNSIIT